MNGFHSGVNQDGKEVMSFERTRLIHKTGSLAGGR
jgi:hypothetical protein